MPKALGLVETKGLVAAIEAADAMLKAANVAFAGKDITNPALVTIKVVGETAAVRSAVDAGAAAASRVGQLVSTHIIPQPDNQLTSLFPEIADGRTARSTEKKEPSSDGSETKKQMKKEEDLKLSFEDARSENTPMDTISRLREEALGTEAKRDSDLQEEHDIDNMNVHQLRHYARSIPDFPIKGREISRANRDELVKHFRSLK